MPLNLDDAKVRRAADLAEARNLVALFTTDPDRHCLSCGAPRTDLVADDDPMAILLCASCWDTDLRQLNLEGALVRYWKATRDLCWSCSAQMHHPAGPGRRRRYCDPCAQARPTKPRRSNYTPVPAPTTCQAEGCSSPLPPKKGTRGPKIKFCSDHRRAYKRAPKAIKTPPPPTIATCAILDCSTTFEQPYQPGARRRYCDYHRAHRSSQGTSLPDELRDLFDPIKQADADDKEAAEAYIAALTATADARGDEDGISLAKDIEAVLAEVAARRIARRLEEV